MKQLFGYTPSEIENGEKYVRYTQAFITDEGQIEVHVRNGSGAINSCCLPKVEALKLAEALISAADDV